MPLISDAAQIKSTHSERKGNDMTKSAFVLSIVSISLSAVLAVAAVFLILTNKVVYIESDR